MQTADPTAVARSIQAIAEVTQLRGMFIRIPSPAEANGESMTPFFGMMSPEVHNVENELIVAIAFRCMVIRTGADAAAVTAQLGSPTPPKDLRFLVEAAFAVRYTLESGFVPTPDEQQAFANVNSPINIVPYWREFVDSAARRCGMPSILAPVHKVEPQTPSDPAPRPARRAKNAQ